MLHHFKRLWYFECRFVTASPQIAVVNLDCVPSMLDEMYAAVKSDERVDPKGLALVA
jgi:hypothetical protein